MPIVFPEEIGKYMRIKHSEYDIIAFCMNDNFLLRPLAQVVQIHQYFLMNFIIMNYFLSLNNRIPMYATSENPKGYIWASFQTL